MGKRKEAAKDFVKQVGRNWRNKPNKTTYYDKDKKAFITKSEDTAEKRQERLKSGLQMAKDAFVVLFNHPEWYENYPLDNFVNLNYGYRKSVNNDALQMMGLESGPNDHVETTVVSEILIDMVPAVSLNANNPMKQAADILFAKIRSANSGSVNYTSYGLLAYILNLRNIRAILSQLRRTLSLSNYVTPYDADSPRLLVQASMGGETVSSTTPTVKGVNYDTILSHKADLYNQLTVWYNTVRNQLPMNIDLFDRTDWMFSNVFKDRDSVKANYYLYVINSVIMYDVNAETGLSVNFNFNMLPESGSYETNYSTIIKQVQTMMNFVISDKTNQIIAGDILKALGNAAFYDAKNFGINDYIEPIYDEAALTQIQNSQVLSLPNNTIPNINFSSGVPIVQYTIDWAASPDTPNPYSLRNPTKVFVNTYKNNMSPGETISYTRLTSFVKSVVNYTTKKNLITVTTCGTELVNNIKYYTAYDTETAGYQTNGWNDTSINPSNTSNYHIVNGWAVMDWSPMFSLQTNTATTLLFDFDNFALVDPYQMDLLHQLATLSLMATDKDIKRQNEFTFAS